MVKFDTKHDHVYSYDVKVEYDEGGDTYEKRIAFTGGPREVGDEQIAEALKSDEYPRVEPVMTEEDEGVDLTGLTVGEVKEKFDDVSDERASELVEREREGKDRKSVKNFFEVSE